MYQVHVIASVRIKIFLPNLFIGFLIRGKTFGITFGVNRVNVIVTKYRFSITLFSIYHPYGKRKLWVAFVVQMGQGNQNINCVVSCVTINASNYMHSVSV